MAAANTTCKVETWKPVLGFENGYEVSDRGNVRSIDRVIITKNGIEKKRRGQPLKTPLVRGYPTVNIRGSKYVHTLVLEAFSGPKKEGMECRHLDGNRINNSLDNLAWGTSSENNDDIVAHGNHWQVKKKECPRGHPLEGVNLIPTKGDGLRECLACNRAASIIRNHPDRGDDMKELSDFKYQELVRDHHEGRISRANIVKTHCPRGHILEEPNLVPHKWKIGHRNCLSCNRARTKISGRGGDPVTEMQSESDLFYSRIMNTA